MGSLLIAFTLATQTFNLPPGLISAICFTESTHNVSAINPHDGNSKSIGVCQVKLATARLVGYKGSEKKLLDPALNIYYSAKYLKKQLDRYSGDVPKAVSAYNAGTYRESNQGYVKKVFTAWAEGR